LATDARDGTFSDWRADGRVGGKCFALAAASCGHIGHGNSSKLAAAKPFTTLIADVDPFD